VQVAALKVEWQRMGPRGPLAPAGDVCTFAAQVWAEP